MIMHTTEGTGLQAPFTGGAEEFRDYLHTQVRRVIAEIVEQEVRELCGARHSPHDGEHRRAGSAPSHVVTEAGREPMQRPRFRRGDGDGAEEVSLERWKMAQSPEQWEAAMTRAVLCGVNTRDFGALRGSRMGSVQCFMH